MKLLLYLLIILAPVIIQAQDIKQEYFIYESKFDSGYFSPDSTHYYFSPKVNLPCGDNFTYTIVKYKFNTILMTPYLLNKAKSTKFIKEISEYCASQCLQPNSWVPISIEVDYTKTIQYAIVRGFANNSYNKHCFIIFTLNMNKKLEIVGRLD